MDKWVQFDQSIVAAIDHAWHHRLSDLSVYTGHISSTNIVTILNRSVIITNTTAR